MSKSLIRGVNKSLKKRYSYQDCWNYAISLKKNINLLETKNNIIAICDTTPEAFWLNFTIPSFSAYYYQKFRQRLDKYLNKNYPVPYLTNRVHFLQLTFEVKKGIFVPQFDTEILVKKVLEISEKYWIHKEKIRALDIGTGCGNIAITLAKSRPAWEIVATDINSKALKIAQRNAKYHQISNIDFISSDLFNKFDYQKKFDLIISNPPYLSNDEYQQASPFVKKQPREALIAPEKGLAFYRRISQDSILFLSNKSLLVMEISPLIKDKLVKLLISWWPKVKIEIFSDYQGQERVLVVYPNKVW